MRNGGVCVRFVLFVLAPINTHAQVNLTDYYAPGEQEKELLIIVHIWGEVHKPGKYIVRDGTNLIDLISEAGGPTRFGKMETVLIAHKGDVGQHIDVYDMKKYIEKEKLLIPVLMPGDVVLVKRNTWGRFLDIGQVTSVFAVILNSILILTLL